MTSDERLIAEYVAALEAAIRDAIVTVSRCRLYEGELDEEERLLAHLRAVLRRSDGSDS